MTEIENSKKNYAKQQQAIDSNRDFIDKAIKENPTNADAIQRTVDTIARSAGHAAQNTTPRKIDINGLE